MGLKIVIVDDASFIREIIKTLASKQNWTVVGEAENGLEALSIIFETQPDVVILDLVMPKLSGLEVAKQVLRRQPDLPIVALSTMANEETMGEALESGVVSYITKPFENWTLINAVREAVRQKEKKSG